MLLFVVWITLVIRERCVPERVLKLELFWAIRDCLENAPLGKQEVSQYLLNIIFFVLIVFCFHGRDVGNMVFYSQDFMEIY